jgi:hypothetical protein
MAIAMPFSRALLPLFGEIMNRKIRCLFLVGLLFLPALSRAQNTPVAWAAVAQPTFDPAKFANINNVVLTRDRLRIILTSGNIQFSQPSEGMVFAAVFQGQGRLQASPPNASEAQQLDLFTKSEELNMDFTEAVLSFTDGTFDEISKQVHWSGAASQGLDQVYLKRQHDREELGQPILPRLFQGLLSADHQRSAFFVADLKTSDGWVQVKFDALDPEEVEVGRWTELGTYKDYDTWMHFPAGGRLSGDAYHDPTAKDDFVLEGYTIDAAVTENAYLSATASVQVLFHNSGERVMIFDLNGNLRVDSAKDMQGNALPFFQAREPKDRFASFGDYLAIVLPQPSQAGQKETIQIHYAGKRVIRQEGTGNYFCPSYGWYPGRPNSFATRANFDLTFHAPKKFTLVATGNKVGEKNADNETITTWKSDIPLSVAGFAYGDYKVTDQKVGDIDLQVFANRQPDQFLAGVNMLLNSSIPGSDAPMNGDFPRIPVGQLDPTEATKSMTSEFANNLRLFQDYFGPYPYSHLAVTNIPFSYGQGWPGLLYISVISFLDSTQRHALGIKDDIKVTDFFRAHETSHQWWGHRVGWKSYHDQWMSEGFAQFSGNLYVQFRENPGEYLKRIRADKQELLSKNQFGHVYDSIGPIWMGERLASSQAPAGYNVVVYDKGGYILHMLRMMMLDTSTKDSDHNFKDLMQDFCHTYENKAASTEDFKALVEKHMTKWMDPERNHRMDWFFNQYVYGTGIPHYTFDYQARDVDGKFTVVGTITQSEVPDGWKDILPVYVHVQGRDVRVGWISITGKTTPVHFTLPTKVDKVSINDDEDILAVIQKGI